MCQRCLPKTTACQAAVSAQSMWPAVTIPGEPLMAMETELHMSIRLKGTGKLQASPQLVLCILPEQPGHRARPTQLLTDQETELIECQGQLKDMFRTDKGEIESPKVLE